MAAMNKAAGSNPGIAARIQLFRYRVPEEFYDLEHDPDCLNNLIDDPERRSDIEEMQTKLRTWMKATGDPMLEAMLNALDVST